jgi:hypothetical protein
MLGFLQAGLQAKSEPSRQLTIERRVLITPKTTVSIANIASITLGTAVAQQRVVWNVAVVMLGGGLATLVAGASQRDPLAMGLGALAMLGGLVLARYFASTHFPCLSIASNGGQVFQFTGQRKTLEEARRLLSDKINAADEGAVYRINFEKGMVQAIHADAIAAIFSAPSSHSLAGNGSAGAIDEHVPLSNGATANGHYPSGNGLNVDYAPVLQQIAEMQRFYAQRQDTQDIAERLNELEYLMRSGTPTASSRSRVGLLAGELASILSAYPSVVQIFQQTARLAGS